MNLYENQKFVPMLLNETSEPFNNKDYIFELKFDGIRTVLFVEPGKIVIRNKRSDILNNRYPELLDIKDNVKKKVIFDGEIVLMTNGKPNFEKLKDRALLKNKMKIDYFVKNYPVVFVAYDILYEDKDLTNLQLLERKKILNKYKDTDSFIKSIYIEEKGIDLFKAAANQDLEGIVAKKKDSKYRVNKRSKEWIKIKNLKDEEFFICGYKEEDNNVMASLILGKMENNKLIYMGKVNIGKKNAEFQLIKKIPKTNNKLSDYNNEEFIYIEPILECTVIFMEKTRNDKLRQPVYKGLKY